MKTCLCLVPFMVCLALVPARAADAAPAPLPVDKPALEAPSDLPKKTDPLIDPLTNTPYIAVHNGDIVESVIFIIEFQRAHPKEHAVLLTKEIHRYFQNGIMPAAAFSWQGKVYIHSQTIGDVLIPGILPDQIDGNKGQLNNIFRKIVSYSLKQYFEKNGSHYPISKERADELDVADAFPHVIPSQLPGDTDDIQAKRVEERLKKLGLQNIRVEYNRSGYMANQTRVYNRVTFDYGDLEYGWDKFGDIYNGLAKKNYLPSLLDSIVFSIDYQKTNPAEKVFCFLHETSDKEPGSPSDIVATTIYTKNGRLWFHHLAPGDLPSSLSLNDLKDSDKVIDADLATYYPALRKFNARESRLRQQSPTFLADYLKGYKASDLSVTGVLAELQKRGVEARITGDPDHPELLFVWGKRPYTYKPGLGCFADNPVQTTASN